MKFWCKNCCEWLAFDKYAKGRPNWCKDCHNAYKRQQRQKNLHRYRNAEKLFSRKYRKEIRLETLKAYGGNIPVCKCCDESTIEFLCIDHIDGGGNRERQEKEKNGGYSWYSYLKKNNWPDGFRVLCHNCNSSLGYYGYCPHGGLEIAG